MRKWFTIKEMKYMAKQPVLYDWSFIGFNMGKHTLMSNIFNSRIVFPDIVHTEHGEGKFLNFSIKKSCKLIGKPTYELHFGLAQRDYLALEDVFKAIEVITAYVKLYENSTAIFNPNTISDLLQGEQPCTKMDSQQTSTII